MSARRHRDPRLPGPRLEDVTTTVAGHTVTSHGLSPVDTLIAAAHQDALERVRRMWGLDRDDWLLAVEELARTHPQVATVILCRWCDTAVVASHHDAREPDPWGFERLADLYHREGDHGAEHDVLTEWLGHWKGRDPPAAHARITRRVADGCGR